MRRFPEEIFETGKGKTRCGRTFPAYSPPSPEYLMAVSPDPRMSMAAGEYLRQDRTVQAEQVPGRQPVTLSWGA
jgi:hypothetical protein